MKTNNFFLAGLVFLFMAGCMSKEEKTTQEFVVHAHSLDISAIKNMSTEDTRFYIKIVFESLVSLGSEESINQLKEIASSLECSGEGKDRICTYLDGTGSKKSFEMTLHEAYEEGEKRLYIHIDKKYFIALDVEE